MSIGHIAALCLSIALLFAGGCAREDTKSLSLTDEERQWLDDHRGAVRLSPCPDYPPIDYRDLRGVHRGLTADYLHWIERKLNYRFVIEHQKDWFTVLEKARKKEIDGVLTVQDVPERRAYLLFTRPYVNIPNIIVTRSTTGGALSPGEMSGMKVSVVKGYAVTDHLMAGYPSLIFDPVPNELAGLMKVSFSQTDAMVVSLSTASYFIEEKGITNLRVAGSVGYEWHLRMAVRKDLPILHSILDKALAAMPPDVKSDINRRWIRLGSHSIIDNPAFRGGIIAIIAATLLIILAILFWNRTLKRQVLDRTARLSQELQERNRTEQALSQEKERLFITLRSIGDGFVSTDTKCRVVMMNRIAEELTGYTQVEAQGRDVAEVCRLQNRSTDAPQELPAPRCISLGQVEILSDDIVLVSRGGERRDIILSISPIRDFDGDTVGTVMIFRDMTERRRMREEQNKIQKLESLGLLAGGIAHDFNNILTAILGNANLAEHELRAEHGLGDGDAPLRLLDEIEQASLRAKNLTHQLLTFARGGEPVKKTGDIGRILEHSISFALRGTNVRARYTIAADLCSIDFDEGQMSQVFDNLAINAQQAMPGGGEITIAAENRYEEWAGGLNWRNGHYVVVTVSDRGCGIPEEHLSRIFDPYFSTKDAGTGLGLTSAYSIVKLHGGYITAVSTVGAGTTVSVYLPVTTSTETRADLAAGHPDVIHASGRILVMDDEEPIRRLACRMLEVMGYTVTTANDGAETLTSYQSAMTEGAYYAAVILDLTVPGGMGGLETLVRLQAMDPQVKAVVSSGYSNDHVLANYRQYGFRAFIAKPFRMEDLSKTLFDVVMG